MKLRVPAGASAQGRVDDLLVTVQLLVRRVADRRRPGSGCYPDSRGQRHADRYASLYGNDIADRHTVVHGPSSITD